MEVDPQLNLFEPVYLLKENALRKLREFDLDGAQEALSHMEISEPHNPFATTSLVAITELRKKLFKALEGKNPLQGALALHEAWAAFSKEAGSRFRVDPTVLNSIGLGLRKQIIELMESAPEEDVMALYPRLSLGHLKLKAGDCQGAAETLRKLLTLHPDDPKILTALANSCYHIGRYTDADEYYLRALLKDTETAFREGVENKVLTLSLESFLAGENELCWFPIHAVLNGALKPSSHVLNKFLTTDDPSVQTDLLSRKTEGLDERDRVRLFFTYMVRTEETRESGKSELEAIKKKMKELNPTAFQWYISSKIKIGGTSQTEGSP